MNPYEPILEEIATGLLEVAEIKPNFSNEALLNATLIFQSVFMDKVYDKHESLGMTLDERLEDVDLAGKELRQLILAYTGLDTIELAK